MTAIVAQLPSLGSPKYTTPKKSFLKPTHQNYCCLFEQFPVMGTQYYDFCSSQSKKYPYNPRNLPIKKQTRKISLEYPQNSNNHHYSSWKTTSTRKISYDNQESIIYSASTASETDASSSSSISSELSGFKIVHNGKTIHNEAEETDSPVRLNLTGYFAAFDTKFASSELMVGPQAKEISLPSFF